MVNSCSKRSLLPNKPVKAGIPSIATPAVIWANKPATVCKLVVTAGLITCPTKLL